MGNNTNWKKEDFLNKPGIKSVSGGFNLEPSGQKRPAGNKKIKNAVKSEVDGIKFDSNLEKHMHMLLTGAGINFKFQHQFMLQEAFEYGGEKVRPITLTVDFVVPGINLIIDTKGYANDLAPVKYKMLKHHLYQQGLHYFIELPSNKQACQLLINRIQFSPTDFNR